MYVSKVLALILWTHINSSLSILYVLFFAGWQWDDYFHYFWKKLLKKISAKVVKLRSKLLNFQNFYFCRPKFTSKCSSYQELLKMNTFLYLFSVVLIIMDIISPLPLNFTEQSLSRSGGSVQFDPQWLHNSDL